MPLLSSECPLPERRLNGWLLVLEAKRIPHFLCSGKYPCLYVPALYDKSAVYEISAFESERPALPIAPPAHDNAWAVLLLLFGLTVWHGLRFGWFYAALPSPPFPAGAEDWPAAFGLDVYRTRVWHQWWRTLTALCIHADNGHLAANAGFGLVFLVPFFRRTGAGMGLVLTVFAGMLGNMGNALFREANVLSLGFSTALFGSMGALCAFAALDVTTKNGLRGNVMDTLTRFLRHGLLPVGAGLALLGLLGGGGEERTDYTAHIGGFCAGVAMGCAAYPLDLRLRILRPRQWRDMQAGLAVGVIAGVIFAWRWALAAI